MGVSTHNHHPSSWWVCSGWSNHCLTQPDFQLLSSLCQSRANRRLSLPLPLTYEHTTNIRQSTSGQTIREIFPVMSDMNVLYQWSSIFLSRVPPAYSYANISSIFLFKDVFIFIILVTGLHHFGNRVAWGLNGPYVKPLIKSYPLMPELDQSYCLVFYGLLFLNTLKKILK